jgi:acetylornithine deacetylase/succinyl-diaminopimelate desuccinylase-like protein
MTPAGHAPRPVLIDRDYVWSLFERFVESDTSVRPGETTVPPNDPRVEAFARNVAAAELYKLGAVIEVDALNNIVGRFGELTGSELAFVSYPVTHHANRMVDPLHARVTPVANQMVWSGLGASQGKAGLAAVCGAARALLNRGDHLAGRVVLAISSEGSSTHQSAQVLYRTLYQRPAAVVMTIGTENQLMLGNRGRVDIRIDIAGQSTHSSSPHLGSNPILQLQAVLGRLSRVRFDRAPHPKLGARNLVPYSLVCGPIAPHTIPESCRITLDRRFLPGDSPDAAAEEVARALADLPVKVSMGPLMLPALTAEDSPIVAKLRQAAESALGRPLSPSYPSWTFDAGYPVSLGIPTLMFGPSAAGAAGADVLNDDHVTEAMVMEAATAYAAFMSCHLEA